MKFPGVGTPAKVRRRSESSSATLLLLPPEKTTVINLTCTGNSLIPLKLRKSSARAIPKGIGKYASAHIQFPDSLRYVYDNYSYRWVLCEKGFGSDI